MAAKTAPLKRDRTDPIFVCKSDSALIQTIFLIGVLIFYCFVWFTDLMPDGWFETGWYWAITVLDSILPFLWFGILQISGPSSKEEKERQEIVMKACRDYDRKAKTKKTELITKEKKDNKS